MRITPVMLILGLALSACAAFPELDRAVPAEATRGPFPTLVPISTILNGPAPVATEAAAAALSGRVAALRARAARLRRPVIDRTTRARMSRGVGPV